MLELKIFQIISKCQKGFGGKLSWLKAFTLRCTKYSLTHMRI